MEAKSEEPKTVQGFKFAEGSNVPVAAPDILNGKTPTEFLKEKYEKPFNFGIENLARNGFYRIAGWSFNFRPFLCRYVYRQRDHWYCGFAPTKALLRKSCPTRIDEVYQVPMKEV